MAAEIAATGADVRVVSLLHASDPFVRYFASELMLQLARRCRHGPPAAAVVTAAFPTSKRASSSSSGGSAGSPPHNIAKAIIGAGGLVALWNVCSDPSPLARPVALAALAELLGTTAAMTRSTATSAAVLELLRKDAVSRLARDHVDSALAVLAGHTPQELQQRLQHLQHQGRQKQAVESERARVVDSAAAVATSSLLALHYLAANPDPEIYVLFLAAAGVDDDNTRPASGSGSGGGGSSTWNIILSSVEVAADGSAGLAFLEAALRAAGSVCGAPPLPVEWYRNGSSANGSGGSRDHDGGDGSNGVYPGTGASFASTSCSAPVTDEIGRILPGYQARVRMAESLAATSSATARGLAARAVALLDKSGNTTSARAVTSGYASGGPKFSAHDDDDDTDVDGYNLRAVKVPTIEEKISRAAIRVVWALSQGPSSATLAAHDTLPRLMDISSSSRDRGGDGLDDDPAAGVLVLDTIGVFLGLEERASSVAGGVDGATRHLSSPAATTAATKLSPETVKTINRTVDELCGLVLGNGSESGHASATARGSAGTITSASAVAARGGGLGPRSLSLLAIAAANPRLRPLLVDNPRFPAVLELIVMDRHLDGSDSVSLDDRTGQLTLIACVPARDLLEI